MVEEFSEQLNRMKEKFAGLEKSLGANQLLSKLNQIDNDLSKPEIYSIIEKSRELSK